MDCFKTLTKRRKQVNEEIARRWDLVIAFYVGMAVAWLITGFFGMNRE